MITQNEHSEYKPSTYADNIEEAVREPLIKRILELEKENKALKDKLQSWSDKVRVLFEALV